MRKRFHGIVGFLAASAVLFAPNTMANRTVGTTASTGLLRLTPGHVAILTLADVGNVPNAALLAQLEILDGEDRILATTRGELRPGQPLELELPADAARLRLPVRGRVHVVDGARRLPRRVRPRPILSFEILDASGDESHIGMTCPFPGGGIEFSGGCGGCVFTDLTIPG